MVLRVPPRYANVEMAALLSEISDGAFREYARLRAISWGKDVVEFWLSEYQAIFGISEATLYRRLSELRLNAGLRFSSTRNAITGDRLFQVSFSILRTENALLTTTTPELTESLELGEEVNTVLNSENGERILKNDNGAKYQEPEQDFPFATRKPSSPVMAPMDSKPAACLNLYCKVTEFPAYPGSIQPEKVEPVLWHYLEQNNHDVDGAAAALEPFWSAWKKGVRTDGRPYSRTSAAWITDWANAGVIPEQPQKPKAETKDQKIARKEAAESLNSLVGAMP